jgi:hypothetical protein
VQPGRLPPKTLPQVKSVCREDSLSS